MSFRSAGLRPVRFGPVIALGISLFATGLMAQQSTVKTGTPVSAGTTRVPSPVPASSATPAATITAMTTAAAMASVDTKPGNAIDGQAKAAVCGACHGIDGNSSDPQYPNLAGQSEPYIVHQLTDFKSGKRKNAIMMGLVMPLSEQDMRNIGAYFAGKTALPAVANQVADQALVASGEKLFREGDVKTGVPACMACHLINGHGNPGSMYPRLAGQHARYIQATLKSWHDGTTWGDDAYSQIMPSIAKKLSSDDIAALASYIEGLHSTMKTTTPNP